MSYRELHEAHGVKPWGGGETVKKNRIDQFGKNMKDIRKCIGLTQVELSRKSGLTQAAICQIESGDREPSLSSVVKIIGALGVTLERMLK